MSHVSIQSSFLPRGISIRLGLAQGLCKQQLVKIGTIFNQPELLVDPDDEFRL